MSSPRDRLRDAFDEGFDLRPSPGLRGRAVRYAVEGGRPHRAPAWGLALAGALALLLVAVLVAPRLLQHAAAIPAGRGTPVPSPSVSAPPPPGPSPQLFRASLAVNGPQYVLFGSSSPSAAGAETWVNDGARWRQLSGPQPPARTNAGMAYDGRQIVLFGGQGACPAAGGGPCPTLGDTWTFDGTAWQQQHPAHSPSPVVGALMTYDPAHRRTVLVADEADGMETWGWDGTDWSQLAAPGRGTVSAFGGALGYDPATQSIVVYGQLVRLTGTPAPAATWLFDGRRWSASAGTPGIRQFPTMADDGAHLYLFGGADATGKTLNDTWEWNGTDWQPVHSAHSPAAREEARMAGKAGQLLLYGGAASETPVNLATLADTWTFDSRRSDWTQLAG